MRSALALGLPFAAPRGTPLDGGLLAVRTEARAAGHVDIAYPMSLIEHEGDLLICFSVLGPEADIQESILRSVAFRIAQAAPRSR